MKILRERWLTNAKPKQLEKKREKLVKQKKKILEIAHWFKSNGMFSYELFKLYNVIHINIKLIDDATHYEFDPWYKNKPALRMLMTVGYQKILSFHVGHLRYTSNVYDFLGMNGAWSERAKEICEQLEKELRDEIEQH